MPDFDFDELDKAVAGALQPDDSTDDQSPVTDPTPTPQGPSTPSEPVKEPEQEKDTPVERAVVPAARRSAGRFMDVVHPSSDMRGRTSSELLTRSSTPATFTPPKSTSKDDSTRDTTPENTSSDAESTDWSQPLESPFLPGAKVEKRPLGAFATRESATDAPEEEELKLEAPDELRLEATTMPDPIDFAAQAAALDAETEDTGSVGVSAEEPSDTKPEITVEEVIEARTEVEEVAPEVEVPEETVPEEEAEPETENHHDTSPIEVAEPETPVGPTSISQQYEEKPSTASESGAIYDTESYHQPLPQSPKKHSGVWTIIWILLLVILGAGAGVAFYLFVLPML